MNRQEAERNQDATLYVGNLDDAATEAIVYELMLQAGPVVSVHIPRDRVNGLHQGYGFVEFRTPKDAEYAQLIMNQVRLFGKPLRINRAAQDRVKDLAVGANLFVGNLDPLVDERALQDAFSSFGDFAEPPRISRDSSGAARGFGFVYFTTFEASDAALDAMNGQYIMNRPCTVSYAFKKDGKGERHGDEAERRLAAQDQRNRFSAQPTPPPLPAGFSNGSSRSSVAPSSVPPPPPPGF